MLNVSDSATFVLNAKIHYRMEWLDTARTAPGLYIYASECSSSNCEFYRFQLNLKERCYLPTYEGGSLKI